MFKKNSNNKSKKFAFSLIELAIVILVIGILMVGASQGYNLVRSAQISNARSITAKSPILQISGLLAWYETSLKESLNQSEIKDGSNITSWNDISPSSILNGANKLSSNGVTYSQSSINKIPSLKFNGSSRLTLANFSQGASSQATVFLVFKLNYIPDLNNFKTIFDGNSSTFSFSIRSDAVQINLGDTTPILSSYPTGFSNSGEYVVAIYFNGSNSKAFINNQTISSDIASTGTNQLAGITLGTNRSSGNGFNGSISEVAIFNRVIKASERKEIFNYFSKKYKIYISGV